MRESTRCDQLIALQLGYGEWDRYQRSLLGLRPGPPYERGVSDGCACAQPVRLLARAPTPPRGPLPPFPGLAYMETVARSAGYSAHFMAGMMEPRPRGRTFLLRLGRGRRPTKASL